MKKYPNEGLKTFRTHPAYVLLACAHMCTHRNNICWRKPIIERRSYVLPIFCCGVIQFLFKNLKKFKKNFVWFLKISKFFCVKFQIFFVCILKFLYIFYYISPDRRLSKGILQFSHFKSLILEVFYTFPVGGYKQTIPLQKTDSADEGLNDEKNMDILFLSQIITTQ